MWASVQPNYEHFLRTFLFTSNLITLLKQLIKTKFQKCLQYTLRYVNIDHRYSLLMSSEQGRNDVVGHASQLCISMRTSVCIIHILNNLCIISVRVCMRVFEGVDMHRACVQTYTCAGCVKNTFKPRIRTRGYT